MSGATMLRLVGVGRLNWREAGRYMTLVRIALTS